MKTIMVVGGGIGISSCLQGSGRHIVEVPFPHDAEQAIQQGLADMVVVNMTPFNGASSAVVARLGAYLLPIFVASDRPVPSIAQTELEDLKRAGAKGIASIAVLKSRKGPETVASWLVAACN